MNERFPDEWTQEEFLCEKARLQAQGINVLLVDTILQPIEHTETITYNPPLLHRESEGTVLVFYCDSGKDTLARLPEYRRRFPDKHCISLRGGRGYWNKYRSEATC